MVQYSTKTEKKAYCRNQPETGGDESGRHIRNIFMRVLFFSRDYTPHDYRFLNAIVENGHECYYLRLEDRRQNLERRTLPESVHIVDWKWGKTRRNPVNDDELIVDIQKVWTAIRPDVVHSGPLPDVSWLTAKAGLHPHAAMSWGFDLMHDIEVNPELKRTTACALQQADWFLGDCYVERDTAARLGLNPDHATIFPWGIDPRRLYKRKSLIRKDLAEDDEFLLLSLRTMESNYSVETIVRAYILAAEKEPALKLALLGDGSQKEMLQKMAASVPKEISNRILWLGRKNNEELIEYYRAADLYLSASITDGSSVSLLEAMAFEVPVLVSAIPGNLEWVEEGKTGLLFETGNALMLAERILDCVENRDKLINITGRARNLICEKADWEKNKFLLTTAYQRAIEVNRNHLV